MQTRAIRLFLRTSSGMIALSEHCSKCRATADDGNIEVNAASLLSLFTLDINEPITVTCFGDEETVNRVIQGLEDDPRLQSYIVNEEIGLAPIEDNIDRTALYKKLYR